MVIENKTILKCQDLYMKNEKNEISHCHNRSKSEIAKHLTPLTHIFTYLYCVCFVFVLGAISCSESAFRYEIEKPYDRFSHPDFNPLFVEDFPTDVQESAKILCGVKNKACIFDYLATKDDSFAKETKTINNEAQQDIKNIGKP